MTSSITSGRRSEQQLIKHQSHPLTVLQDTLDPQSGVFKLFPWKNLSSSSFCSLLLLLLYPAEPPRPRFCFKGQTLDYEQQRISDVKQCEPSQMAKGRTLFPSENYCVIGQESGSGRGQYRIRRKMQQRRRVSVRRAWNSPYTWNQAASIVHFSLKWLKVFRLHH